MICGFGGTEQSRGCPGSLWSCSHTPLPDHVSGVPLNKYHTLRLPHPSSADVNKGTGLAVPRSSPVGPCEESGGVRDNPEPHTQRAPSCFPDARLGVAGSQALGQDTALPCRDPPPCSPGSGWGCAGAPARAKACGSPCTWPSTSAWRFGTHLNGRVSYRPPASWAETLGGTPPFTGLDLLGRGLRGGSLWLEWGSHGTL